jgi:hypothetical protein
MNLCRISARIGTRLFLFIWISSNAVPGIMLYAYPGTAKSVKAGGAKLLRSYKWIARKQGTWASLRTYTSHIKLWVAAASLILTPFQISIMLHHCQNVFVFFNHQGWLLSTCEFQSFWKFRATNMCSGLGDGSCNILVFVGCHLLGLRMLTYLNKHGHYHSKPETFQVNNRYKLSAPAVYHGETGLVYFLFPCGTQWYCTQFSEFENICKGRAEVWGMQPSMEKTS